MTADSVEVEPSTRRDPLNPAQSTNSRYETYQDTSVDEMGRTNYLVVELVA